MGCTKSKDAATGRPKSMPTSPEKDSSKIIQEKDANVSAGQGVSKNKKDTNKKQPKFADRYKLSKELGKGNYSTVKLAEDQTTGQLVAVKCIDEKKLNAEDKAALTVEIDILHKLDHPNIIKFHGFYHEAPIYYIITEYVGGGELFDRIVEKEFYSEKDAQKVVRTVVEALKYCHDRGVVHRDLKPENILLTKNEKGVIEDSNIKLADFGFAKNFDDGMGKGLTTSCGTPGYVAPEILQGKTYGKEVDLWSLGVILYILLCGYPPFVEEDDGQRGLFEKIKRGQYSFTPPVYWANVSETAKDLIKKLLVVDGKARLDVDHVLAHPWLSEAASETDISNALTELRKFQARRRWKASIGVVQAAHRMSKIAQLNSSAKGASLVNKESSENGKPQAAPASITSS